MTSPLFAQIYATVDKIPSGKVVSYRQVAIAAGLSSRAARVVGWALRQLPPGTSTPWQRVVNCSGRITIINPHFSQDEQRRRLQAEGIGVIERDGNWYVENWQEQDLF